MYLYMCAVTLVKPYSTAMPMNRIQFQPGLSLAEFLRHYGDEAQCEAAVVKARWPNGFVCDRRQCTRFSPTHNGRKLWQCNGPTARSGKMWASVSPLQRLSCDQP